ncbi:MAG: rhodanese-like domain-containing protein [Saprospiraceae bacterium]|nr:rhodanese-like domain-containing protein [Saprospiraceae bacterium]
MKYNFLSSIYLVMITAMLASQTLTAQDQPARPHAENPEFHEEVAKYVDPDEVPLLDVKTLYENYSDYLILDARAEEEFKVSHLPGARYVGYKDFDMDYVKRYDRSTPIVVYCSIGYRSSKIGEKLREAGYNDVYNLYGSIFEWVNRDYPLDNMQGERTDTIHAYNQNWSQWIFNPNVEIVW